MLLALDIGNTNLTLGLFEAERRLVSSRRAATRPGATADEMESMIDGLLRLDLAAGLAGIDAVALASVVPRLTDAVVKVAKRRGLPLIEANAARLPIAVRVANPREAGADRLVNALAVQRLYGTPAIVVDFGTTTNFDVVDRSGAYLGGAIAPGLELGLEALAARTAKLPRIELRAPDRAIGNDTVSAMLSGAVLGYVGLTREIVTRIAAELVVAGDGQPFVVLTGGLSTAPWVLEIGRVDAVDPDLTLKGLAILHEETMAAWGAADAEPLKPEPRQPIGAPAR